MNKLEVGMYVRYTRGAINGYVPPRIGKIIERLNDSEFLKLDTNCTILENDIIGEPSFNPIDLIEVGDILEINNEKYEVIYDESYEKLGILIPSKKEVTIRHISLEYVFKKYKVSIVTKEQFSSIKYRLGDK